MANPKTRKAKNFISRANQKVTIGENSTTTDGYGGTFPTWTTQLIVWAIVDPLSSSETLKFQQMEADAIFRVTIRYHADLYPHRTGAKRRIKVGTRFLDIIQTKNVGELNEMLEFICIEGGAID